MVRIQDEIDPQFRTNTTTTTTTKAASTTPGPSSITATTSNNNNPFSYRRHSNPTTSAYEPLPIPSKMTARRSSLAHVVVPRPMRRSSIGGCPVPEPSVDQTVIYENSEFRDFKERMRATRCVTAVGIHQALHTDEDPLQTWNDSKNQEEEQANSTSTSSAPDTTTRMKRRNSLHGHMKRVLTTIQAASFSEEAANSASSFGSSSSSIGENDLKNRYMNAMSMNLHHESWE